MKAAADVREYRVKEDGSVPSGAPAVTHSNLVAALDDWAAAGRPDAIVTILDSRTYALPPTLTLRNEGWLVIQAAERERPLLQATGAGLALAVTTPSSAVTDRSAALTLSGVVIEGSIKATGDLGRLRLLHSTLVPGRSLQGDSPSGRGQASLEVDEGTADARIKRSVVIELDHSISGPLIVPDPAGDVRLFDSIVDGFGAGALGGPGGRSGPTLVTERSTILGTTEVRSLQASDAIFTGLVKVVRRQEGCLRFSFAPPDSECPRRYRCQPDVAVEQAIEEALAANPALTETERQQVRAAVETRVVPSFTSDDYGHPAYCQLARRCPAGIRAGAEDGAEMGAFAELKQPQREANLTLRLQEYLPFGLAPGIIYVT